MTRPGLHLLPGGIAHKLPSNILILLVGLEFPLRQDVELEEDYVFLLDVFGEGGCPLGAGFEGGHDGVPRGADAGALYFVDGRD